MKKFVFYICSFALISFTVGDSKKIGFENEYYNTCLTENNVSNDDMFTFDDIIYDRYKQSENQERINKNGCIMQCLLQKEGVMEESEYIIDKFYSLHIKKTNIESELDKNKALENCLNKTKDLTEKCNKSFALTECFLKAEAKIRSSVHEHEHEAEK